MASISNFVAVTISSASAKVLAAGFGIPMIAAYHTHNVDRIRFYEDPADMIVDGFTTTEGAYLAAVKLCSQDPRPEQFGVGRLDTAPDYRWALTPVVGNSVKYSAYIDGLLVEFTADGSATFGEIYTGFVAAAGTAGVTGLTFSNQTTYIRALAVAGTYHTIKSNDVTKLAVAQDNAAPANLATELDAIKIADNSWYAFGLVGEARGTVLAAAAWADLNQKVYAVQLQDSAVITAAYDNTGAADTASQLKVSNYGYTFWIYHPDGAAFAEFAWLGRCLPLQPGSETWAFKTLDTVDSYTLTTTQRNNVINKNGNAYENVADLGATEFGQMADGEFIDIVRGRDWLIAKIGEAVFTAMMNVDKIPFTDKGIAIIEGILEGQLQRGVKAGLLSDNPAPAVLVPKAADIDNSDKIARHLPDINFTAVYAGAVHDVAIQGVITF